MPRLRMHADQYAKSDFRKELEKSMIDVGIKSKTELAGMINMDTRTLCRRFEDVGEMRVNDLKALVDVLKPNPALLLRLVGYSSKEIARMAKNAQQ